LGAGACSEALLNLDPAATEGQLAPRFNALVRKEALCGVAREIDMGAVPQARSLEDAYQAVGASSLLGRRDRGYNRSMFYLDGGFTEVQKRLILRLWGRRGYLQVKQDAAMP